jgi:hypothetical protein
MLIKQAIITYCKANFGWDNPDAERFRQSYESLRNHLALTRNYSFNSVTFTVVDISDDSVIREAKIKLWNDSNNYNEVKYTDENGQAIFYVRTENNYKYDITASDYGDDLHSDEDKNLIDVTANTDIDIDLTGV